MDFQGENELLIMDVLAIYETKTVGYHGCYAPS
jgi:hypothetical protein